MNAQVKTILKKVTIFDIIIAIISGMISYFLFKKYDYIVVIGLLMAVLNFVLNAITTNYILITMGKKMLSVLGSAVRIIITFSIAIILCKNNIYNFIAFLIGYSLHYIAVIFYGITVKNEIAAKK